MLSSIDEYVFFEHGFPFSSALRKALYDTYVGKTESASVTHVLPNHLRN